MPEGDHTVRMSAELCEQAIEYFREMADKLEEAIAEQCPGVQERMRSLLDGILQHVTCVHCNRVPLNKHAPTLHEFIAGGWVCQECGKVHYGVFKEISKILTDMKKGK